MFKGSCLCGGVSFEADGVVEMRHCHCSRCRKARGTAFSTHVFVRPGDFRWLGGEELLRTYPLPGAKRFSNTFCSVCGSPMPRTVSALDMMVIPAGALDEDPGSRPACHIFVSSKAPWHEITDRLKQFREYPE